MKLTILCLACIASVSLAQDATRNTDATRDLELTRDIWDTGFIQRRPTGAMHASPSKPRPATKYEARSKAGDVKAFSQAAVGFTLWRLRVPNDKDDSHGARLLLQEVAGAPVTELLPERIDSLTPLHVGERVRLSIEAPCPGFLYVIDRERYGDGSRGNPVLLFPTLNMNGGDNEVAPGRVVEIPPRNAAVIALRISRSSERHIGEDIEILISPKKLEHLVPSAGEQTLPPLMVDELEKQYSASSIELALVSSSQTTWSAADQKAGAAKSNYLLSPSDPPPANIISVTPHQAGTPILVHVPLTVE